MQRYCLARQPHGKEVVPIPQQRIVVMLRHRALQPRRQVKRRSKTKTEKMEEIGCEGKPFTGSEVERRLNAEK